MKKIKILGLLFLVCLLGLGGASAQSAEVTQLTLNVEKLSQLKNMLSDMKKGYTVVSQGYRKVKDIASGNFSLHEFFLDGMMVVSPHIKKYRRVADIISCQKKILDEYKAALKAFNVGKVFNPWELSYLSKVYASLFDSSLENIEELTMVITSSKLRMSDDERLKVIDRIFLEVSGKLEFLRGFNREAVALFHQKKSQQRELEQLRKYYQ